ncbi:hypothetical protein GZ77_17500 [Endozoicomonas montiporae]|uniref:Uncharacterized protein n=2 Tax=Endozoicomonas montiporae TaxID=1027273 RepID=A0A081N1M5_9GAMM|nr:hypothetical protein [Endozoicomonas montiporae]AMO58720.1 hypothetical protein EZMO1_4824 [Endozoicomonas montiporae CL-33]KEQ12348.1 hypothetical protein GZ77_17500 [Endozoicomonas montiporae]
MTVKELISLLKQLPEDKRVFVRSYEEGFDPVCSASLKMLEPEVSGRWYVGCFQSSDGVDKKTAFEGVIIGGDQRSP